MCAISAGIGSNICEFLKTSLFRMVHRGYDSAGIYIDGHDYKTLAVDELKHVNLAGKMGLGHLRWASVGSPTIQNAHPIYSASERVVLVHNGNVENIQEIKNKQFKDFTFKTQTDTEIIANLMDLLTMDMVLIINNLRYVLNSIKGRNAFVGICKDKKGKQFNGLFFATRGLPLYVAINKNGAAIVSEKQALNNFYNKAIRLRDYEYGVLLEHELFLYQDGRLINDAYDRAEDVPNIISSKKSIHFMYDEIHYQTNIVDKRFAKLNMPKFKNHIFFGCGSSYYAGIYGKYLLNQSNILASVEYASELIGQKILNSPDTLFIAMTQSGETSDVLAAIEQIKKRDKNNKILCITNNAYSSATYLSDYILNIESGPERAVAATKTFTLQCLAIHSLVHGDTYNIISQDIQNILDKSDEIKEITRKIMKFNYFLYLGRNFCYPIVLEGALKLKEVAQLYAEGMCSSEVKHGPIALISPNVLSIFLLINDSLQVEKVMANMYEIKARQGAVLVIHEEGLENQINGIADWSISVPKNHSVFIQPLLCNVVLQLIAYYAAVHRGLNPDRPRNLAKTVCVE